MTKKDLKLMAGNIIKESEYSLSAKKQLLNFIINEASETQIKSLILDGKIEILGEDSIDIVDKRFEISLENVLQENLNETQEFLTIGRETICDLLESGDFEPESFEQMIDFVVNEASDYQILSMLMEGVLPEETENIDKGMILTENLNEFAGTTFILTEATPAQIDKMIQTALDKFKKWSKTSGPKAEEVKRQIRDKLIGLRKAKQAAVQSTKAAGTPGAMAAAVQAKKTTTRMTAGDVAKGAAAKASDVAGKAAGAVSKFAQTPAGHAVGGLAAAALIGYAAYKIYKNFFSKAAKACKGSADKGTCMKQYKNKAVQAQISSLNSGSSKCAKSKDPAKCKAAIQNKIAKLKGQAKA